MGMISLTQARKKKRRKKDPRHVFDFKKKTKIYLLGLGSNGALKPTRSR
jgi:hypothetical protein